MTRSLLALLCLAGCSTASSYTPTVSPLAYRAVKSATGAAATFTLERVGLDEPWAGAIGVLAPVIIGKLARPQHRHSLGDWGCDTVLSAAVVPILVARPKKGGWRIELGLLSAAAWLGAVALTDQSCSP